MLYFTLCLILNIWIFIAFRLFKKHNVQTFEAICVNYLVCIATGALFLPWQAFRFDMIIHWGPFALLLGLLFISTFFLLALTTQQHGMSTASVTSKTSMAIPIILAFWLIPTERSWDLINIAGLALAFPAIIAVSVKEKPEKVGHFAKSWWQPISLFVLSGLIDAVLNYANAFHVPESEAGFFTWTLFFCAGIFGWTVLFQKKRRPGRREWQAGLWLGIPNYFSIFFLILALAAFQYNGAVFFPILNMGIILGSTLISLVFFKEKLSPLNILGLVLAVLAVAFLSWQEIILWI